MTGKGRRNLIVAAAVSAPLVFCAVLYWPGPETDIDYHISNLASETEEFHSGPGNSISNYKPSINELLKNPEETFLRVSELIYENSKEGSENWQVLTDCQRVAEVLSAKYPEYRGEFFDFAMNSKNPNVKIWIMAAFQLSPDTRLLDLCVPLVNYKFSDPDENISGIARKGIRAFGIEFDFKENEEIPIDTVNALKLLVLDKENLIRLDQPGLPPNAKEMADNPEAYAKEIRRMRLMDPNPTVRRFADFLTDKISSRRQKK
ncbi:hypothetical protein JYT83_01220 [bacterium AH-315-F18]|nr:hypothetical protein [bacterium AH-315-F18]